MGLAAVMLTAAVASEDIVITGALPAPALERAFSVSVVTADDLAASGAVRLDDALRLTPGFQIFRRASSRVSNPTTQGVTLRALGGNAASRVTVLLDGVPQEDPFAGWIPFSAISLPQLDSVRVTRGGGSVVAGSGALAGAIAIETKTATETSGEIQGAFGSFNSFDVSGGLAVVQGRLALSVSGNLYDSDGYVLIAPEQRGAIDVPAKSRARSVRAAIGYALDENMAVHVNFARFDEHKLAGFAAAPSANDGLDISARLVRDGGDDAWRMDSAVWYKKRDFSSVFAASNTARTAASLTLDQYAVPGKGWGARTEIRAPRMGIVSLRFGADAKIARGETRELFRTVAGSFSRSRVAGGRSEVVGGFVEGAADVSDTVLLSLSGRVDRWRLTGGIRQEQDRATGALTLNRSEAARRGTEWTGRTGAVWNVTPALTARAAGYIGWRLPTLNELYRPFRVGNDVTEANAGLAPERLKGVDLGLAYAPLDGVRLDLTLFWNQLDGAISNVTLGSGPGVFPDVGFLPAGGTFRRRGNLPGVRSRGLEVQGAVPLARGFSVQAGYAFADAKVSDAGAFTALQGKRLTQSPRHQGNVQLRWAGADGRFGADATTRAQSRVFEDDANSRGLRGFVSVDLTARARLGPGWELFGTVENATNARITSAISGDGVLTRAQPRSVSVGIKAAF